MNKQSDFELSRPSQGVVTRSKPAQLEQLRQSQQSRIENTRANTVETRQHTSQATSSNTTINDCTTPVIPESEKKRKQQIFS